GSATDVRIDIDASLKEPESATPAAAASAVPAPARKARLAWITAAFFAIVAAALAIPYFRSKPAPPVIRFEIALPSGSVFGGVAPGVNMEISPDGKNLAFTAAPPGKPLQLYIRSLDAVDPRPVPGTENAAGPFWSPDSRFVGFLAGEQLKKVDINSG